MFFFLKNECGETVGCVQNCGPRGQPHLQREESHALQEIHKGRKGKARAMKTLLELV